MKKYLAIIVLASVAVSSQAAWYWPFGGNDDSEKIRLSDLVEQASIEIDNAVESASDGDMDKAIEHYRKALAELDRIERENKDLVSLPEYASLRNKRAYVSSSIDSILLEQSRLNAKAVRVTNTAALEKKLQERKLKEKGIDISGPVSPALDSPKEEKSRVEPISEPHSQSESMRVPEKEEKVPKTPTMEEINAILLKKPDDAKALNLRAKLEAANGDWKAAEATLDRAIMSNPQSYHAYYNMASLILKNRPGSRDAARRYYESGRQLGGPCIKRLEKEFK